MNPRHGSAEAHHGLVPYEACSEEVTAAIAKVRSA